MGREKKMESRYFITVEWCKDGKRGVFCDAKGRPFSKETEHSTEEMNEILGAFEIILSPKSEPFTQEELKEFNQFRPLAEYTNQYGIAFKK